MRSAFQKLAAGIVGSLVGLSLTGFVGDTSLQMGPRPKRRVHLVHSDDVVATTFHRAPQWRRHRTAGGKVVHEWMPNVVKEVPIMGAFYADGSRNYRGRLGAKDKARRAAALGGAA